MRIVESDDYFRITREKGNKIHKNIFIKKNISQIYIEEEIVS
jgi:hypothetical protein